MSTDTFVLYSPVRIPHDEYNAWLHQLNAEMKPHYSNERYDGCLSRDMRYVWVSLIEEKWFEIDLAEFGEEPEMFADIRQLIGGRPRFAIALDANDVEGSQILAVQFAALCAEHYPCVVYQSSRQALYPRQEVLELRDAGMGFDGLTWETADPTRSSWFTWTIERARQHEALMKRAQQQSNSSNEDKWPFESSEKQHKEHLEAS